MHLMFYRQHVVESISYRVPQHWIILQLQRLSHSDFLGRSTQTLTSASEERMSSEIESSRNDTKDDLGTSDVPDFSLRGESQPVGPDFAPSLTSPLSNGPKKPVHEKGASFLSTSFTKHAWSLSRLFSAKIFPWSTGPPFLVRSVYSLATFFIYFSQE
jgi:hypothetical protein